MYLEKLDLSGQVAVITGGGRNIGLACAHALAEAGATIVITGREDSEVSRQGQEQLADLGYKVDVVQFDVADSDDVNSAADVVAEKYGVVDILVCNSFIGLANLPTEDTPDELWLRGIDTNLHGVFRCCRAFGKKMLEQGKGSIVNIGSISGTIVNKPQPQCEYNVSKAAVHHLTRCLAAEWALKGVRVNAVAPNYIDNGPDRYGKNDDSLFPVWMEMTPMRRQGRWDEVASAVLFLASDASSLVTGQILHADGGYTLW